MKAVIPIPPIITPKYPIDFVFSLTEIKNNNQSSIDFYIIYIFADIYEIYLHPQIQFVSYSHVPQDLF